MMRMIRLDAEVLMGDFCLPDSPTQAMKSDKLSYTARIMCT